MSLSSTAWHDEFLQMLPAIESHPRFAFRDRPGESRDEADPEDSSIEMEFHPTAIQQLAQQMGVTA